MNINLFSDSSRDHAFLIVPYFEVSGLRWQNVEPLRLRRVVNQAKFHRMRFICLKPCEFHHTGRCLEETVGADRVVDVLVGDRVALVGFSFGK